MEITEIHFDTIDSTNLYAKREYRSFFRDRITCVTADCQTAGRGRYERKWVSPKGVNLYATFCFRLASNTPHLGSLAMLAAYSIATLLQKEGLHPKIKWPNDVQLSGKKVSGVLCETLFEGPLVQILLGIGLNVNMEKSDLEKIDQPATSLLRETNKPWDRAALLKKLQTQFSADLERFKKEGFAPFHDPVENLLAHKGEPVRVFDGQREWAGVCHSLGKDGSLNLQLSNGTIHSLHSGDMVK